MKPLHSLLLLVGLSAACHQPEPVPSTTTLVPPSEETRVTVLHFSDYHSHAVPYFSEHAPNQGGIARAIGYIKSVKAAQPYTLVLNGGDMWNAGTPAWSDKYSGDCTEWKWLGEHVAAMAFGNHDVDYGWPAFAKCRDAAAFPILSANFVDSAGKPLLTAQGKPYLVKQVGGVRIGIFALAGADFGKLVKPANIPAGASFQSPMEAAATTVRALRDQEKVDAVVFIGHQDRESDFAMAKAVPGIDLILGTHSHYKGSFMRIPDTQTYFISPFQYLNYLSQVELVFRGNKLSAVFGKLIRMSENVLEDPALAANVTSLQRDLEQDPTYSAKFMVIGSSAVELDTENLDRGESVLGNFAMDIARVSASAHAAFSSASSFRASIPPGPIRMEDYLTALPYKNKILTFQMTGTQIQALLDLSASKQGSDNFGVTSGFRYVLSGGRATSVQIALDKASKEPLYEALSPTKTYTVMTTDYLANIAAGYKDIFAQASSQADTGLIVNDEIIAYIRKSSPVSAKLEGRVQTGLSPLRGVRAGGFPAAAQQ
jgi:5'-nucleotidase/UDP-sugar diphosphatase